MAVMFDTLKFALALKEAGVPEKQAQAEAAAIGGVIGELVTKGDLLGVKEDLLGVKESLKAELKSELKSLEDRVNGRFDVIEARFDHMKWMMGFVLAALVGVLVRLFFIRGPI